MAENEKKGTISVFGALTLYIISMISQLTLRKKEPNLERPFKVPMYPAFPVTALVIAIISFVAMTIFNLELAIMYFVIMGICFGAFKVSVSHKDTKDTKMHL